MSLRALFAALLVLVPLAAFAGDPHEITVQSVLDGMNARRAEAGLPPLALEPRLMLAADDRIRDMEDLGYWGHVSPDGRAPFVAVKARGYDFALAGENLAAGFETIEVLIDGWMESKGHRENILSSGYTECGIALIDGSTTARRMPGRSVVVLFGRPLIPTLRARSDRSHEPIAAGRPRDF